MKVSLWVLGQTKAREYKELIKGYNERLQHYLKYDYVELNVNTRGNARQVMEQEKDKVLKRLSAREILILWDVRGKELSSEKFAYFMQDKMLQGNDIVFLIGGAYGFHRALKERARHRLSLSKMTFNHQIVRLIVLEQLYRAMTILRNEPYHNA